MTNTIALDNRFTFRGRLDNKGSSPDSNNVLNAFKFFNNESSKSETLGRKDKLKTDLKYLFSECSKRNWDGYDASPLSLRALIETIEFVNLKPLWMADPDIVPEPSGDIGFQWDFGENRIFTVSFSGNGIITYAGILGSLYKRRHGMEEFSDSIPEEIIEGIRKICE